MRLRGRLGLPAGAFSARWGSQARQYAAARRQITSESPSRRHRALSPRLLGTKYMRSSISIKIIRTVETHDFFKFEVTTAVALHSSADDEKP